MAYAIALAQKCSTIRCPRTAKFRVFDGTHKHIGDYCEICSNQQVAQLTLREKIAAPPTQESQT
jgi:hypothetical protein